MAATIQTSVPGVAPGLPGGVSSAINITAAQVIKAKPGVLATLVCVVAGSITLNDSATTGGAGATNEFYTNASMTAGQVVPLNWPCFAGITASVVTTGTFSISFS